MVNYKKLQAKKERAIKAVKADQKPIETTALEKQMALQKCDEGSVNLQFRAIDTWFFRESRPHDAAGASELSSLFPPPVFTLMGAVRSFLGDRIDVVWHEFKHERYEWFRKTVGNGEHLGQLSINGAWVCQNEQRLYPAPFYLMHNTDDLTRLQIGGVVECDLGKVRLPELPKNKVGYKNLEQAWITNEGWQALLKGNEPDKKHIVKASNLFDKEPRLGIARNNESRTVVEGQLYQTQHLRLKPDVAIQLDVKGLTAQLTEKLPENAILRLGSEARMAALQTKSDYSALPSLIMDNQPLQKVIVHFITAANFNGQLFPKEFEEKEINGQTVWQGEINGITLIIEAAVIGKVHREGGWDMQKHQPRAVKSYIPAGSAWFCRVETEISGNMLVEKLNGCHIGNETEWGRGQILIGLWNDTVKTQEKN